MSDEWIPFNLNRRVRVKLGEKAIAHARDRHVRLFAALPPGMQPWTPPKQDADGWSEMQAWQLIQDFGGLISHGMMAGVMETTILLEPVNEEETV